MAIHVFLSSTQNQDISDSKANFKRLLDDSRLSRNHIRIQYVTLQGAEPWYVMNSGGVNVIYACKCFIFNNTSRWMKRFIDDPEAPHFDKKNKKKNQHIHWTMNSFKHVHVHLIVQLKNKSLNSGYT